MTIVTTDSNDTVAPIHDRMPVILEPADEDRWLESDDEDELQSPIDPHPGGLFDAYPMSKQVNDPGNDSPDVIEPDDIGEQIRLGEFG